MLTFRPNRCLHDMPTPTNRRSSGRGTRATSWVLILALAWFSTHWLMVSPMAVFSKKFTHGVFFPPDGPQDRLQYFHNLVIANGERVDFATCVLCSITVEGFVDRQATTLWGDVTVESTGHVVSGIEATGGGITLASGSDVGGYQLSTTGGLVVAEPGNNINVDSWPGFFYPGQR